MRTALSRPRARKLVDRALPLRAAAMAVIAVAATAGMQPAGVGVARTSAELSAPVIHERFTPLACPDPKNPSTTLEMEGCAEHAVLRTDVKIDRAAKAIFPLLGDDAARRRFIKAQAAWLVYRDADCASVADKYEGGTLSVVVHADCAAGRTMQHLKEIRAFERLLHVKG